MTQTNPEDEHDGFLSLTSPKKELLQYDSFETINTNLQLVSLTHTPFGPLKTLRPFRVFLKVKKHVFSSFLEVGDAL